MYYRDHVLLRSLADVCKHGTICPISKIFKENILFIYFYVGITLVSTFCRSVSNRLGSCFEEEVMVVVPSSKVGNNVYSRSFVDINNTPKIL